LADPLSLETLKAEKINRTAMLISHRKKRTVINSLVKPLEALPQQLTGQ
jgi:hypothetical protein